MIPLVMTTQDTQRTVAAKLSLAVRDSLEKLLPGVNES